MNTVEVRNEDIWTRATSVGSDTMAPRETVKAVAMSVGFGLAGFLFLVANLGSHHALARH
jgi:hypothetical protein